MKSKLTKREKEKNAIKVFKSLKKQRLTSKNLIPGTMVLYRYDAKDRMKKFDKTPCNIVLRRNKTHTLCLALHWCPLEIRRTFINFLYKVNRQNIKNNKPLVLEYKMLKSLLKKLGALPVIRLYINKRMSKQGIIVPHELMKTAIEYSNADFYLPPAKTIYSYMKRKK